MPGAPRNLEQFHNIGDKRFQTAEQQWNHLNAWRSRPVSLRWVAVRTARRIGLSIAHVQNDDVSSSAQIASLLSCGRYAVC
jgi:hypothetical protein